MAWSNIRDLQMTEGGYTDISSDEERAPFQLPPLNKCIGCGGQFYEFDPEVPFCRKCKLEGTLEYHVWMVNNGGR